MAEVPCAGGAAGLLPLAGRPRVLQAIAAGAGWSLELHPPRHARAAEIGEWHHGCTRTTIHERAGGSSFYKETGAADGCAVTGGAARCRGQPGEGRGGGERPGPRLAVAPPRGSPVQSYSESRRAPAVQSKGVATASATERSLAAGGADLGQLRGPPARQCRCSGSTAQPLPSSAAAPRRPHVLSSTPSHPPAPSAGVALTAHTRRRSQRDPHAATARQSTPACVCAHEGAQVTVHPLGLCARWAQCRSRCRAAGACCSACARRAGGGAGRGVSY